MQNLTLGHTAMSTISLVQATIFFHLDDSNSSNMVFLLVSLVSLLLRNTPWFPMSLRRTYSIHVMNTRPYMIWPCSHYSHLLLLLHLLTRSQTRWPYWVLRTSSPANLPSDPPDSLFMFVPSILCSFFSNPLSGTK